MKNSSLHFFAFALRNFPTASKENSYEQQKLNKSSPIMQTLQCQAEVEDYLERIAMGLPEIKTQEDKRNNSFYFSGVLATLLDFGQISVEIHDLLYPLYCF